MDFTENILSNNHNLKHFSLNMGHHTIKTNAEREKLLNEIKDLEDQKL